MRLPIACCLIWICGLVGPALAAEEPTIVHVEGQPLAANVARLLDALALLGTPLADDERGGLRAAIAERDASNLQKILDPHALFVVSINPESRVKVRQGLAKPLLKQGGYTPLVIKVINESTVTHPLSISSPQAGPVYGGVAELSLTRQDQVQLKSIEVAPGDSTAPRPQDRFLHLEMFHSPPMTDSLSGLAVEYAIALAYSTESGRREATIGFDVGQGTQDLGFRGEAPVLFDVRPAVNVQLSIADFDGSPTTARLTFRDAAGHVYPAQAKRLAPDLFFQQQIYRHDGETVLLPPGEFTVEYSRGPEYRLLKRQITIAEDTAAPLELALERWINPIEHGYFCGDHHIHAAGCAHYTSPSEGVSAAEMFRQVKGEGLNVGCVLTWGPCYEFQRQFFSPGVDPVSEPRTLIKYDVEVSGFGSQALGHVCLLNLLDQSFPGSRGTKNEGWPTWTTPLMRWAKEQHAVTGYAHSASGLQPDPASAAKRLMAELDLDKDQLLTGAEAAEGLLPEDFSAIDGERDNVLSVAELERSIDRVSDRLPNLAVPEMNGVGAQEVCVTTALGLCDFISAMDTARIPEWNCWYHIMNCGFPLKVSGETDFPCMSSTRVGQGRVYVYLGQVDRVDFGAWCENLARGRSYVSDGYAHAFDFNVDGKQPGEEISFKAGGTVSVKAMVAFGSQTPLGVPQGGVVPKGGKRFAGDTVVLHEPRREGEFDTADRRVELVVNGRVVETRQVPADDQLHELTFSIPIERSSWVALRQFPQFHTNPVVVQVAGAPIRASRKSARWCAATIEQLWRARANNIAPAERAEAEKTFQEAIAIYRRIAAESPDGS